MLIGFIVIALYVTVVVWVLYVTVINIKLKQAQLHGPARVIGYSVAAFGIVIDFLYNLIVGTVIFFQLPREFTFTARLRRILATSTSGYRWRLATAICNGFLKPFDPGHCG